MKQRPLLDLTTAPPALPEQQYTPEETARLLRISLATLRRMTLRGDLVSIGKGRLRRYALRDIRDFQDCQRKQAMYG